MGAGRACLATLRLRFFCAERWRFAAELPNPFGVFFFRAFLGRPCRVYTIFILIYTSIK